MEERGSLWGTQVQALRLRVVNHHREVEGPTFMAHRPYLINGGAWRSCRIERGKPLWATDLHGSVSAFIYALTILRKAARGPLV